VADAREPRRRLELRDDVAPHPSRRRPSSTRARRRTSARRARCSRSCARNLYERIPKNVAKIFSFKAIAEAKSAQHAADVRHLHAPRELPLDEEARGSRRDREDQHAKAQLIYDAIDGSAALHGTVVDKAARSHMNVTFRLPSEELTDKLIKEASARASSRSGLPDRRRHPRVDLQRDAARGCQLLAETNEVVRQSERLNRPARCARETF